MNIEILENIMIAYMRNVGEYGDQNIVLMEKLKNYLKDKDLFTDETVILGIALDHPTITPKELLRYDVGIIVNGQTSISELDIRQVDDGRYAIFEVPHTKEGVLDFWNNIMDLTSSLSIDTKKPIIERYQVRMVKQHLCEFCVPLKEEER